MFQYIIVAENPHGSFGGYHTHRHNIIDDLIGIIDKSNLNFSYKSTLKSEVRNGNITNKIDLDNKIKSTFLTLTSSITY